MDYRTVRARPEFCFGRTNLIENIVASAKAQGAVLLFGGRQAGKSTIMLRIASDLSQENGDTGQLSTLTIPVYVDLLRLDESAQPIDFFRLLVRKARVSLRNQLNGTSRSSRSNFRSSIALEFFEAEMRILLKAGGQAQIHFLFLLDEVTKLLNNKNFQPGFYDNLNSILYGYDSPLAGRISMAFSGTQDLFRLIDEETTSRIGVRAAKFNIVNLEITAIHEMIRFFYPTMEAISLRRFSDEIFMFTGGQAGTSAHLTRRLPNEYSDRVVSNLVAKLCNEHAELFNNWYRKLSPFALVVQNLLLREKQLRIPEISRILSKHSIPLAVSSLDRALDELEFSGVAHYDRDLNEIRMINNIYVQSIQRFHVQPIMTASHGTDDYTQFRIIEFLYIQGDREQRRVQNVVNVLGISRTEWDWSRQILIDKHLISTNSDATIDSFASRG